MNNSLYVVLPRSAPARMLKDIGRVCHEYPGDGQLVVIVGDRQVKLGPAIQPCPELAMAIGSINV